MKSEVYFTRTLAPEMVVEAYEKLSVELPREGCCENPLRREGKSELPAP